MEQRQYQFTVALPVGYRDERGVLHRQAVIRKMRGHEEALFYDPELNSGRLVTELIRGCLVRLGDREPPTSEEVSHLYTADRNYLLLEIRRVTLGDQLRASYACPNCRNNIVMTEDLSKIRIRRLHDGEEPADVTVQLEDGYVDQEGTRHTEMVLRLPTGMDEEFVAPMMEKDPLKARDALILRCIERCGTMRSAALEAYGVKMLRDLTLGDRRAIDQALNKESPGVDVIHQIQCSKCGHSFLAPLDMSSFFLTVA
jgi:hypothetical protein